LSPDVVVRPLLVCFFGTRIVLDHEKARIIAAIS
jgi:hypothetical protein